MFTFSVKPDRFMHDIIQRLNIETYDAGVGMGKSPFHWSVYWGSNDGKEEPFRLGVSKMMPTKFVCGFIEMRMLVRKMIKMSEGIDFADPFGSEPEYVIQFQVLNV